MDNPTLNVNKVFIEHVNKCLRLKFHESTMIGKINVLEKVIRALLHY